MERHMEEQKQTLNQKRRFEIRMAVLGAIGVVVVLGVFLWTSYVKKKTEKAEVVTVSTLQKIINVSQLSTFTAVYNGIAKVMNENKPEEIDYYVSYEAKINAGIDFEKVEIELDEKTKIIYLTIPEVYITDINVDIGSMDFIFYNEDANKSTISQAAYKACEADVQQESKKQESILELARQNAENILTALIDPILEQMSPEFSLVVE